MKKTFFTSGLSIILAMGLVACNDDDQTEDVEDEEAVTQEETGEMEMPEPEIDLSDVPDTVAEVNGEMIAKEQFEEAYTMQVQQMAMYGMDVTDEEHGDMEADIRQSTVEGLVNEVLLMQEVENRDIEVDEEALDEEIETVMAQSGIESEEEFLQTLEAQGLTEEDLREEAGLLLQIEQLAVEETGEIEISDEDIQNRYEEMNAMEEEGEQEMPELSEVEEELRATLESEELNTRIQSISEELRENSSVEIHV